MGRQSLAQPRSKEEIRFRSTKAVSVFIVPSELNSTEPFLFSTDLCLSHAYNMSLYSSPQFELRLFISIMGGLSAFVKMPRSWVFPEREFASNSLYFCTV